MARPKKEVDWDLVREKIEAGCTAKEIYPDFFLDSDTFYIRFKEEFGCGFQDYTGRFRSNGLGNLKHAQYKKALEGNPQMQIWLGKQWLDQKDNSDSKADMLVADLQSIIEALKSGNHEIIVQK